jgi:hypothetical protein
MPTPEKNETERDYVARCVPMLVAEGKDHKQAVAVCYSMYDEHKRKLSASADTFAVRMASDSPAAPLPLALEGAPTQDSEGNPIHYRRMLVARVGKFTHRGSGEEFSITPARADEWIRNTSALSTAGVKPFVPGEHREKPNAKDNFGYVHRLERNGDEIHAITALHGDDALKVAARNSRSIYIVKDAMDANGKIYKGESLHHLALVPNPALPDLGGTVKIAASAADRPAIDVPLYVLAAAQEFPEMFEKDFAKKLRESLGIGADVPDDKLAKTVADKALALSADVTTITKDRDTLKTDLTAKAQEVLTLSANDKEPDALSLSLITRTFKSDRDRVIESGVVSEAGMKEIDSLLMPAGKPGKFALSLAAGSPDPVYCRLMDILRRNPGVKTDNAIDRDVKLRTEAEDNMRLTLSGNMTDVNKIDRQAELMKEQLGIKKSA